MIINKSTISGNNGGEAGGGIYAFGCPTTITDSTISNNTAAAEGVGGSGGGIWAKTALTINNSTIAGNTAFNGAGINLYPIGSTATFRIVSSRTISGTPGSKLRQLRSRDIRRLQPEQR